MMNKVKILIVGIGNPIPPFIHRRLVALTRAGMALTVVAEFGQRLESLPEAKMVYIGGKPTLLQQMVAVVKALLMPHLLFRLMSFRTDLKFAQRFIWAIVYFPLTRVKAHDIVHIQWLASLPEYDWLRNYFCCPFIGSARGSQITVYPLTRTGHKSKIELAIERADYIHCVSMDMARACARLGASKEKLFVNYNGIDLQKFKPLEKEKSSGKFTMISVGSMMWRKGLHYQLHVMKKLCDEGRDVELFWIGEGPDREGLQYTAHLLGIADRITFIGKVQSDQLPGWLTQADLYLSTSVAEGLANSVVEAIACGLPVLAFACEGMEEAVRQRNNGFILPVGDVQGMVDNIIYLIDNSNERMKMGFSSRQHAVENFDANRWVSRMVEKYKAIAMHLPPG